MILEHEKLCAKDTNWKIPPSKLLAEGIEAFEKKFKMIYVVHQTEIKDKIVYPPADTYIDESRPIVRLHLKNSAFSDHGHITLIKSLTPQYAKDFGGISCLMCRLLVGGSAKHVQCKKRKVSSEKSDFGFDCFSI